MPPPSKILTLPRKVKKRLDDEITARGFSGYVELADWIAEQGHPMHPATIARHGQALRRRIEQVSAATASAQVLVDATPDDAGAMAEATLRQGQATLFDLMVAAEGGDIKEVTAALRALTEAARASVALRAERRKTRAEAAQAADKAAKKAGVSQDTIAAIRQAIEGEEAVA